MKILQKIFTFLKDEKVLETIKTKLSELAKEEINDMKPKLEVYIKDKAPAVQEAFVNYILTKVSLPIYLKPFKGLIKTILNKNIDKIEDFIILQLQK